MRLGAMNEVTRLLMAGDGDARGMLGEPADFLRKGAVYARSVMVICSTCGEAVDFVAGGAEVRASQGATVLKRDLPHAPRSGDVLIVGGERFYVGEVSSAEYDPVYHLVLGK